MAHGLFVGLTTLDVIYHIQALPHPNQKIVAEDSDIAAGGPATNAAVAFHHLGQGQHQTTVLSSLGRHPLSDLIRADLATCGLAHHDLTPHHPVPPPTSSILVTQGTGDRAVVSLNAIRAQATPEDIPAEIWTALRQRTLDLILLDGHQMAVSQAIAPVAHQAQIPIVIDGGSWKPGFEQLLPWADYVICSAQFHPPGCATPEDCWRYLHALGIPQIVITQGGGPILWWQGDRLQTIPVPVIQPVDTLGAGDIFHGAVCHALLTQPMDAALRSGAHWAALACQSRGTRRWRSQARGTVLGH
jgi:sugar/nucleoside kinase (ribokinase family)